MTTREKVQSLVDALSEEQLAQAERLLQGLASDPLLSALARAPPDDEPYTEAPQREDEAARARYDRGEAIPQEEIGHLLGTRCRQADDGSGLSYSTK